MAKDRKKLQHIHSSVPDKQPTAASLEVGEIAVNNAKDQEFLSLKNSDNKVVRFSSDEQMVTIMEKKEVIPYSGTVDNVHLDTNRSNIEIKLNQVVAGNTVKHDVVNGAKDIDGNLVNPTSDGGLTNGAGFAIDTSAFALTGGNPSFSSITVTNKTTLSGVTNIYGPTNITGGTYINGDLTVNGEICPSSGLCKTLTWTYGSVCNESNGSTNFKNNESFVIPKTISDVTCGDVINENPGTTSGCLNIGKDVCVVGKVTASDGFFQSSDRNLKENIERPKFEKFSGAFNTPIKKFNYKNDETKRDTYGIIAQEAEANGLNELIYTDENGNKAVDYTSLLILKIGYLENEIKLLRYRLNKLDGLS